MIPNDNRVLDTDEMRSALRLLHRELGVAPDPNPHADPWRPIPSWRSCCGCSAKPLLSYLRDGKRYCPNCWDGPEVMRWPDMASGVTDGPCSMCRQTTELYGPGGSPLCTSCTP